MTTAIKVTPEQLLALASRVGTGAGSIQAELDGLARALQPLGGDWAGAAQAQFGNLWLQWQSGAKQVRAALEGIGTLLAQAGAAYGEAERQIAMTFRVG